VNTSVCLTYFVSPYVNKNLIARSVFQVTPINFSDIIMSELVE